ncbi:MAG TPA: FAD-linked oxidase C-terminal domain-containing protein [Terriglobia bacterium]|nr:FAD-linked oxidase C-terminal domain-containing protein [Terriglobia bacterium]
MRSLTDKSEHLPSGAWRGSAADARLLFRELSAHIRGEVHFDEGHQALYSTDSSNYRQVPIGVVVPQEVSDIIETVAVCRDFSAPILMRGAGTSLAGQCCNVAVILDTSKHLNKVLSVDPNQKLAWVEPGLVLDHLRNAAERYHLTFGPDPATHQQCTLGGMIGNNSCGVHSIMAGKTVDNVEELEILTYDGLRLRVGKTSEAELDQIIRAGGRRGEIYSGLKTLRDKYADLIRARYPDIPRRVSGYNLDQLLPENGFHVARSLVGTEGTCAVVLEAKLCLIDSPPARVLLALGYPDIYIAGDQVPAVMAHGPTGLEGFDDRIVENMRRKRLRIANIHLLPEGGGWLLAEFGGPTIAEAAERARGLMAEIQRQPRPPAMKLLESPQDQRRIWAVREAGLAATSFVPGEKDTWEGWEDAAVPPSKVGHYLRDLSSLLTRYGYRYAYYGHFGHGCVHNRIDFDLRTAEGIRKFRSFLEEASDMVLAYGGSFSGEHGDGQGRAELLQKMFGPELIEAFREFKRLWDPEGKMNPGKIVDPYRLDQNLRLGTSYNPSESTTHFGFPDDHGSFAHTTLRCVGVGKCRKTETGGMCPSFMATREERYSTRGRARLLFEMLEGKSLQEGWRDEHVKEALDLCLACKACKGECPAQVDMATYKAEFLAHYYQGRLRPRSAYAMGLIYKWARFAALMPKFANFSTQAPGLRTLAKKMANVAPQRQMPRFAAQTFQSWVRRRNPPSADKPPVLLWPDTFSNHFHPEIAQAAVEVLESAGFRVEVPQQHLCCGRPLYDFGMLKQARKQLRKILTALGPQIAAGVPVVVLEPSCAAVFRDELTNLFPHDEDAARLRSQSFLLSEFLVHCADNFRLPRLTGQAIVHGHCHQQALMGMESDEKILSSLGLNFRILDSGCCGMAGNFGFQPQHYDISVQIGERVLLPAVRQAGPDTLIIADGFSCREQISQTTGRRALHLAEVIQRALKGEKSRESQ